MPFPPSLNEEQRQQALVKASEARRKRASIKESLKNGKTGLNDLIGSPDEITSKMKVTEVLTALPGVGKIRAGQIMKRLEIAPSRRIRGLGSKQKEALLKEFNPK